MNKTFNTLYKRTSTGAKQEWTISVKGNKIVTRWGQTDGAIQETTEEIKEGKNLGRANATTPEQQAMAEAHSRWEKKLKKDYTLNADVEAGETSSLVEGGILPMLAKRYDQDGAKIKFPAYAQPKLDGHRCIAIMDNDGKCTLWSRTRKPINSMPHIVKAVEAFAPQHCVLDGELYNHDYRNKFDQLTHFIRQNKPETGGEVVEYHIYDGEPPCGGLETYTERLKWLDEILGPKGAGPLTLVPTLEVADETELMAAYEEFVSDGYEGAIVRNAAGLYVNKRSFDLQKIKGMQDAEFKIVNVAEGRGKLAGHGIFVCETKSKERFSVKMKGPLENLKQYWEGSPNYIGKQLTVQFQNLSPDGIPRFPVGLRLREDI